LSKKIFRKYSEKNLKKFEINMGLIKEKVWDLKIEKWTVNFKKSSKKEKSYFILKIQIY
jgi:hypothetical protein